MVANIFYFIDYSRHDLEGGDSLQVPYTFYLGLWELFIDASFPEEFANPKNVTGLQLFEESGFMFAEILLNPTIKNISFRSHHLNVR